jgi:hypothetical protein
VLGDAANRRLGEEYPRCGFGSNIRSCNACSILLLTANSRSW